jgi:hypothetical protein
MLVLARIILARLQVFATFPMVAILLFAILPKRKPKPAFALALRLHSEVAIGTT